MEKSQKHLLIIAGEASGDMHAASLVKAIQSLNPQITFSGVGGSQMEEAGVKLYSHLADSAVVGFTEVIKHLPFILQVFKTILKKVKEEKPDAVILVDFPGFNLRLAKKLKKLEAKVIYYISPQVWAWDENRVQIIKDYTDKMLVLFEFEKEFYEKHGLEVEFVGHPLLDAIEVTVPRDQFLQSLGLSKDKLTIGIMPGSRQNEIKRLLPAMLGAARILHEQHKNIQFLLMQAPTISIDLIHAYAPQTNLPLQIVKTQTYNGINACDVCMVASGTATLETAILQKPMVVVYKTSLLTWVLAKFFIKIPYIGLVNVVAGKRIVPECIQFQMNPQNIAHELENIFSNEIKAAEIRNELQKVKESLGSHGASQKAAQAILKSL